MRLGLTSTFLLLHWHCARLCTARLINRTIDDERGDEITGVKPKYSPDSSWTLGPICTPCSISKYVDVSQVLDGSWHDASYYPTQESDIIIEAIFNGTAVYVYHLIPDYQSAIASHVTDLTFYIDGMYVGQYGHTAQHPTEDTPVIIYQVPVYTNNSLTSEEHTLHIRASGVQVSVVLFDYIVYTVVIEDEEVLPSPLSSPPVPLQNSTEGTHHAPVGLIAGATVGGVALTICVFGACLWARRRLRGTRSHTTPSPSLHPTSTARATSRSASWRSMLDGRVDFNAPLTTRLPYTRASSETFALEPLPTSRISPTFSDAYPSSASATLVYRAETAHIPSASGILPHENDRSHQKIILRSVTPSLPPSTSTLRSEMGQSQQPAWHAEVAELREEVERLRAQFDAPPEYV